MIIPVAAIAVDIITDISLILSMFIPAALAYSGFEPTAVIEVPSFVLKNAHTKSDANAKNIVIEIKDGGKQYIRVSDDGVGIPHAELSKVFLRHSTSKIQKIEDLENLQTCGFRGEALSSICAVSKTNLMKNGEVVFL